VIDDASPQKKPTRRARFLAGIDQASPWKQLDQLIEPFYPKVTGASRRPIGITPTAPH
jgi:IS5 family transposase